MNQAFLERIDALKKDAAIQQTGGANNRDVLKILIGVLSLLKEVASAIKEMKEG